MIQHAGLFPHKTVVDNVATVPKLLGWDKRRTRETAMELLERVGLDPKLAERYPAQLSGGQQQRVGVARALAADPAIMLMDEPFSAVDPIVRHQLQEELLRLQRDIGKTIVFVTHDIDEAIKLGDNVAVLQVGGKLAQFAPPAELLANPVDDFVRGFVGQDRGYRALTFVHPDELPVKPLPTELAAEGRRTGRLAQRQRGDVAAGRRGLQARRLAPRRPRRRPDLTERVGRLRRRRRPCHRRRRPGHRREALRS